MRVEQNQIVLSMKSLCDQDHVFVFYLLHSGAQ